MEPAVTKEMAKPEVSFGTSFPTQIASVKDTSSSNPMLRRPLVLRSLLHSN